MILNSKIKQKSKTVLGRIRNLVLNFVLYFVTAYIYEKVPYIWEQGKAPNTLCITWESDLKKLCQTIYNSNYTQKCSNLLQWKM